MSKIELKNYNLYKKHNNQHYFGNNDYIIMEIKAQNIHSDIYFAFAELIWPTFIVYDDYIFLKNNFDQKRFEENKSWPKNPELWHNIICTYHFFDNDDDWEIKSKALRDILLETWKVKLNREFPDREFVVFSLEEALGEDEIGISFYQLKNLAQN